VPIIENYIERNFGGISYEIDIYFNLLTENTKEDMKILKKNILKELIEKFGKDSTIIVPSVYLFIKIYNEACTYEENKKKENIRYNL
jgi:hypothetical protein